MQMNRYDQRRKAYNLKMLEENGQLGIWSLDRLGRIAFCAFCSTAIKAGDMKKHKKLYHKKCHAHLYMAFKYDKFNIENPVLAGNVSSD